MAWRGSRFSRSVPTARSILQGLGVCFAVAFASLAVQVKGLVGPHGIVPARDVLRQAELTFGGVRLLEVPTVFWLGASDAMLVGACVLGVVCALLLILGVAPRAMLLLLWVTYLSLVTVGDVFLGFQWDVLLLEAAVMALPLADWKRGAAPATFRALLPTRFLLFKLMLLSGLVKLTSGDGSWRDLTALSFHFWTQPLPAYPGYLAAQLPDGILRVLCGLTLGIELLLPLGVFGPRRVRKVTAVGFVLLQTAIGLTGNYGFFNLLTCVLCLSLLVEPATPPPGAAPWKVRSLTAFVAVGVFLSTLSALERFTILPAPLAAVTRTLRPLGSINAYGLFANMTTTRREITVEGSADGTTWKPYVFRDKPGPLARAPSYVQPHQPRLDWQLWFAALGTCDDNPWFMGFLAALLENRAPVTRLLAENPFPREPPRYLRTRIAPYRFTTLAEHRATGQYWLEGAAETYCPTVTSAASSPR